MPFDAPVITMNLVMTSFLAGTLKLIAQGGHAPSKRCSDSVKPASRNFGELICRNELICRKECDG
jgi:hypothetical protein